jgi:hypothetical protein
VDSSPVSLLRNSTHRGGSITGKWQRYSALLFFDTVENFSGFIFLVTTKSSWGVPVGLIRSRSANTFNTFRVNIGSIKNLPIPIWPNPMIP